VRGVGVYERLGTTIDDALGEAFDKTAKLLGLGQPGGPAVERAARSGDPARFAFPRPLSGRADAHFSFAGLKTAVRRKAIELVPLTDRDIADLCASFQAAAMEAVTDRVGRAMELAEQRLGPGAPRRLVVAGGVAANATLRARLDALVRSRGYSLHVPPAALCTDNGAMIAWAGAEHLARGAVDDLSAPARPRWPLDQNAPAAIGAGVKA
jgi:N6-L-threonylcarbamoyladenine synthase